VAERRGKASVVAGEDLDAGTIGTAVLQDRRHRLDQGDVIAAHEAAYAAHEAVYPSGVRDESLQMVAAGLRRAGIGALTRVIQPADNVRVGLTHYVDSYSANGYRAIVEAALDSRAPIDAEELAAGYRRSEAKVRGRRFAVTFDDGLLSAFEACQEVLNPVGIKATFFVPTMIFELRSDAEQRDFFRKNVYRRKRGPLPPERYVPMTRDHVLALRDQGHLVMPHTHSHVSLASLHSQSDVERELVSPKAVLEDLLQVSVDGFAFPFGTEDTVSPYAYEAVRRIYAYCFTGLHGANTSRTDPYYLHRDCLHPFYAPRFARDIVAGNLDLAYALKARRLKRRTRAPDRGRP
jgi:peptidoglycan/xylan/chitin deacetylase (PgdA/CDA1 family)